MLSIRFFQPPAPIESFPNLSPPIFLSPQPCAKINSTLSRKRKNSPLPALPVRPLASPHAPAQTLAPPNRRTFLHLAILILISLALYAPSLRNGFVTDDKLQILQNPMVLEGKNLGQAFTAEVWDFRSLRADRQVSLHQQLLSSFAIARSTLRNTAYLARIPWVGISSTFCSTPLSSHSSICF